MFIQHEELVRIQGRSLIQLRYTFLALLRELVQFGVAILTKLPAFEIGQIRLHTLHGRLVQLMKSYIVFRPEAHLLLEAILLNGKHRQLRDVLQRHQYGYSERYRGYPAPANGRVITGLDQQLGQSLEKQLIHDLDSITVF